MKFSYEPIKTIDGFPFNVFMFEGKDGNYIRDKHWHQSIEIFATFEGDMDFFINNKEYHLSSGDYVIVNSNEVHSIHSPTPNKTIVMQIPLNVFQSCMEDGNVIFFEHKKKNPELMPLLKEVYLSMSEQEDGYEFQAKSKFYSLMYMIVTMHRLQHMNTAQIQSNKNLMHLSRITSYMEENYSQDLSLDSLSGIFGYSPSYISHMFRKYAQTTFKTYLQNVRLDYAYRELVNSRNSIVDIAMTHGFPNSKSFSLAFRRRYGTLPSAYRKNPSEE